VSDLIAVLLTWIALQMGCAAPAPPCVEQIPPRNICERFFDGNVPDDASVVAIYDRKNRVIYLSTAWRADSISDRGTLVHELVHHVQEVAGIPYPCLAAREKLAYHLQAKWLQENGVADPYKLMNVDEFTIMMRSLCPTE
jgi:hypothetical protein